MINRDRIRSQRNISVSPGPLVNRVYSNSDPLPGIAEQRIEEESNQESDESSSFHDLQIQNYISQYPQIRAKISAQLKKFNEKRRLKSPYILRK